MKQDATWQQTLRDALLQVRPLIINDENNLVLLHLNEIIRLIDNDQSPSVILGDSYSAESAREESVQFALDRFYGRRRK